MTPKQQIFVREYLIDLNATQAALRAGYKHSYAWCALFALFSAPARDRGGGGAGHGGSRPAPRHRRRPGDGRMGQGWLFQHRQAGDTGARTGVALRDHTEVSADDTAAIAELSLTGKNRGRIKELHDKRAALDALARHLGLFRTRSQPFAGDYSNARQRRARAVLKERIEQVLKRDGNYGEPEGED